MKEFRKAKGVVERYTSLEEMAKAWGCKPVIKQTKDKEKLKKRGLMRSRVISALGETPARDVFRRLSYDRFHIIVILNQKQEPLRFITEANLVHSIIKKGFHISLLDV